MSELLEALHRLQDVELQLAEIRRGREAKARRVTQHQRRVQQADREIRERLQAARERQIHLDVIQLEIATREESIDKHRQGLNQAKTNKDYAAILTALNTEKADTSKLETEVLQLMEEVQTFKDEAAKEDEAKTESMEAVARAEEKLNDFDAKSKSQRDELDSKRESCAEALEPTILEAFARVALHHDGEALAPVERLHPKRDEFACAGCNMTVTLEVVNSLHTGNGIQFCTYCGRILYLETAQARTTRA